MFRVIWRRRGVRSRGASSNWMDSDPPFATGKKQRSGLKSLTNAASQHFLKRKKMQFFVKIAWVFAKVRTQEFRKSVWSWSEIFIRCKKKIMEVVWNTEALVQCGGAPGTSVAAFESCTFWVHLFKNFNFFDFFFSFSWGSIQFELALRSRALKPHQNFRNCPIFEG